MLVPMRVHYNLCRTSKRDDHLYYPIPPTLLLILYSLTDIKTERETLKSVILCTVVLVKKNKHCEFQHITEDSDILSVCLRMKSNTETKLLPDKLVKFHLKAIVRELLYFDQNLLKRKENLSCWKIMYVFTDLTSACSRSNEMAFFHLQNWGHLHAYLLPSCDLICPYQLARR